LSFLPYIPSPKPHITPKCLYGNTFQGSFRAKEVGFGDQIGFSQNKNPTWPLDPNNLFECKMKQKSSCKGILMGKKNSNLVQCKFDAKSSPKMDF